MPPVTRVGRYLIEEEWRAEPLGRVFRASLPQLDRRVLVEILTPPPTVPKLDLEALTESFLVECRRLSQINDPAVLRPYDFGQAENGAPFRVFDRLDCAGFRPVENLPLTVPAVERIRIAARLAHAIAATRAAGVGLDSFDADAAFIGPGGEVQLVPIGVGRLAADLTLPEALRATPPRGTPAHAQSGAGAATFSLAVWLYRELSGPGRHSPQERLAAGKPPDPLWLLNPGLHGGIDEVLQAALHPSPRISTPTALAEALEAWLARNFTQSQAPVKVVEPPVLDEDDGTKDSLSNRVLHYGAWGIMLAVAAIVAAWVVAGIMRPGD